MKNGTIDVYAYLEAGDIDLDRIIDGGWLVPYDTYLEYLNRIQE